MHRRRIICFVTFCLLFLTILTLPLTGCVSKEPMQEINWDNMHGAWISADGEVTENHKLSMRGSVPVEYEGISSKTAELDFLWPDHLNHMNYGLTTLSVFSNSKEHATDACPFYVYGSTSYYEPKLKKPVPLAFVLFPDDGAVVFEDYENDRYFVASTDSNANLKALLDLYKEQVLLEHDRL